MTQMSCLPLQQCWGEWKIHWLAWSTQIVLPTKPDWAELWSEITRSTRYIVITADTIPSVVQPAFKDERGSIARSPEEWIKQCLWALRIVQAVHKKESDTELGGLYLQGSKSLRQRGTSSSADCSEEVFLTQRRLWIVYSPAWEMQWCQRRYYFWAGERFKLPVARMLWVQTLLSAAVKEKHLAQKPTSPTDALLMGRIGRLTCL